MALQREHLSARVVKIEPKLEELARSRSDRLLVVVGYDGSDSSQRALAVAPQLIAGRFGSIEVVFVAHSPFGAELSFAAQAEMRTGFDAAERQFEDEVRNHLHGIERRWRFHRRDYGGEASVIIVVGSADHVLHHVVGSVPVALVRHAKYPVVVVP